MSLHLTVSVVGCQPYRTVHISHQLLYYLNTAREVVKEASSCYRGEASLGIVSQLVFEGLCTTIHSRGRMGGVDQVFSNLVYQPCQPTISVLVEVTSWRVSDVMRDLHDLQS